MGNGGREEREIERKNENWLSRPPVPPSLPTSRAEFQLVRWFLDSLNEAMKFTSIHQSRESWA
jgi:hypothetical protein